MTLRFGSLATTGTTVRVRKSLGGRTGPRPNAQHLATISLPTIPFAKHSVFYRMHPKQHGPVHFGCGNNRFDSPDCRYGVMYLGIDAHAAFVETFCRRLPPMPVSSVDLADRMLSHVSVNRELRLVDLTDGATLVRIGADLSVACTHTYGLSRAWSKALYEHKDSVDGIQYYSRLAGSRLCFALFDRVAETATIADRAQGSLMDHQHDLTRESILELYGVTLL